MVFEWEILNFPINFNIKKKKKKKKKFTIWIQFEFGIWSKIKFKIRRILLP